MKTQTDFYPRLGQLVAGEWLHEAGDGTLPVIDPATEEPVALLPKAGRAHLDAMLAATQVAGAKWSQTPERERAAFLQEAAKLIRERVEMIAAVVTLEQGKPLGEARQEVQRAAAVIEWNAAAAIELLEHEGTQPLPSGAVTLHPVGPVAAFTPWNVPVLSPARKISMALASGCPCIVKPAENTPGSAVELVRAFVDAGVPSGVLGLALGDPVFISDHLIRSPVIRRVTFTGSVPVGKHVASLAGSVMKPATMELGGHNPVLILADANVDQVAGMAVMGKFRNAGQICTSPTRFYVQEPLYEQFVKTFTAGAASLRVGSGFDETTQMGPLASPRRLAAVQDIVDDTIAAGAVHATGGTRIGRRGYFFAPTVLTRVPADCRFMREEPFGPVASVASFETLEEGIALCNHASLGLASYVFSTAPDLVKQAIDGLESGVVGVNRFAVSRPELPFGGIKDSGFGREGGREGLKEFLVAKTVAQ